MSDENDLEQEIPENDEDYWVIERSTFFLWLFVFSQIFLITAYYQIEAFANWIIFNFDFINTNLEMAILFYSLIAIPYFAIWIIFIVKIIRSFWVSYEFAKLRIFIHKFRINFSIFGIISTIIFIAFNKSFTSPYNFGIAGLILIIINIAFIDYSELEKEERKFSIKNKGKVKFQVELTYFQTISTILFVFFVIFYIGNATLAEQVNQFLSKLYADKLMGIVFLVTLIFSIFWYIVAFLINSLIVIYTSIQKKLFFYLGLLYFFGVFYFIVKLIIFNLSVILDEPYPTLISLGVSSGSILLKNNGTKIVNWVKVKKGMD